MRNINGADFCVFFFITDKTLVVSFWNGFNPERPNATKAKANIKVSMAVWKLYIVACLKLHTL